MTEYSQQAKEELWEAFDEALGHNVDPRRPGDKTTDELKERYGLSDETIRYRMKRAGFKRLKVVDTESGEIVLVWRAPTDASGPREGP